jgi:hypothetical protein
VRQHGKPRLEWSETTTGSPRGTGRAGRGDGGARSSQEASNDRGAKGPWFKGNAASRESAGIDVSLPTPESVRKLQRALYAKAKAEPAYRFYALYDKIYRQDVLGWAWSCCRANGGSAGVDLAES